MTGSNLIQRVHKWIDEGNDCEKCPCYWCDQGWEDFDQGCYARRDAFFTGPCYMPWVFRWYLGRKAYFEQSHEFDDAVEFAEEVEHLDGVIADRIKEELGPCVICYVAESDGKKTYHEMDRDMTIGSMAMNVRLAIDEDWFSRHPNTLRHKWTELLKETWKRFVFSVRYFLTI